MVEKVTFDADARLIIVNYGVTLLDAEIDLYSAAKREWKNNHTLNKLRPPFRSVAGDPLGGSRFIGAYFFLQNQIEAGWRIRPSEANHELVIIGNLYSEDASQPMFVSTLGEHTVAIHIEKSSLTQKLVTGSGVTPQDKEDIANLVWLNESDSALLDFIKITSIRDLDLDEAKMELKPDIHQLWYSKKGTDDVLIKFILLDKNGDPTDDPTKVFVRVPIYP